MRKQIFLFFFYSAFFLIPATTHSAGITLTQVPQELYRVETTISIHWQEPIQANLKYGHSSGQYTRETQASGTRSLGLIPKNEGMTPGVYYCVIAAGTLSSAEFKLMLESPMAAHMQTPANNVVINTSTPVFAWDEVPGVPFYHLILSDKEVTIREDANGELQLANADIIWQVITPKTRVTYGDADPSGFFAVFNGTVPPLLEGFEYNWVVLNNYNNHPAYASTVQGGVSSFKIDLDLPLTAPNLTFPAANANLTQSDITFQWAPVTNAVAYQVLLSETKVQAGSESSYLIWRPTTTETRIEFPARFLLKNTRYAWRVVALDAAGRGVSSNFRLFSYQVPFARMTITTMKRGGGILPRVEIALTPQDGSTESSKLLTTDSGALDFEVQPGSYGITAVKEGFADTTVIVMLGAGDSVQVRPTLRELVQTLSGRVQDQNARAIAGAQVIFDDYASNSHKQILTDGGGNFRMALTPGTWYLSAALAGYKSSDTLTTKLNFAEQKNLAQTLTLTENLARLVGKVTTSSGVPIGGVRVSAENHRQTQVAWTDQTGMFGLDLIAGDWRLRAEKIGLAPSALRSLTLARGETRTLAPDIILNANAAMVTGFVYSTSKPLAGARVQAIPRLGTTVTAITGPRGSYVLSLSPGEYVLSASLAGQIALEEPWIQLSSGQTLAGLDIGMAAATALIKGQVLMTGVPVKGALVRCDEASDTTRADGSYELAVLPGKHSVQAYYRGLLSPGAQEIELDRGQTRERVQFNMIASAGVVVGVVYASGLPVPATTIMAQSGTKTYIGQSGPDGSYWLSLPAGIWDCTAKKIGFEAQKLTAIAVGSGQTVTGVDFTLKTTQALLRGTISDSKNRRIKTALVRLAGTPLTAASDRLGNYAVALDPGTFQVLAEKTGFIPQQKSVTVTANSTQALDFSLPVQTLVTGVITGPGGKLLDGIILTATNTETLTTVSDHAGEYWLHLNAGNYLLSADQLGYAATTINFAATLGDTLRRNFALAEAPQEIARIVGKITDSKNQPLNGAAIRILSDSRQIIYSNFDGSYRTDRLATGKNFNLKPFASGRFFVPEEYNYKPLTADQNNQNFLAGLYGDVSANESISAFDGSLILRLRAEQEVAPYYKNLPRDSVAADVSGNREVSPFDAALIFRYTVGLIDKFPIDRNVLVKPEEKTGPERVLALQIARSTATEWVLNVVMDDASGVYAGELTILYDAEKLNFASAGTTSMSEAGQLLTGAKPGRLKIVFASAYPLTGTGALCQIFFQPTATDAAMALPVRIAAAVFNEREIPVRIVNEIKDPDYPFQLFDNYPNPFNATTVISYTLPRQLQAQELHRVKVSIYNVLGQQVRVLMDGRQSPGPHQVRWDGLDDAKKPVPSGMYFYRIQTDVVMKSKKLLLIR